MKQIKTLLTAAVLLTLSAFSYAQTSGKVTGTVKDGNERQIESFTISLISQKDSSLLKVNAAERTGKFQFENVSNGDYLVRITGVGHKTTYSAPFTISETQNMIDLGTIEVLKAVKQLKDVVITNRKPFVEVKADRTVVNVESQTSSAGATALEILEKSPGVYVDKDGNISLKGKTGVQVYIDGKPSYLSGNDLANMLKNMQASQLEQLEIMTNPPARYDAAGNAGIINIKTKKNKIKGFNGSISAAYNQGKLPKTNEGINLNYRNGKVNLFGNYNFGYRENWQELSILRKFRDKTTKNLLSIFDQTATINNTNRNNNYKAGADFYLSKKTTIGVVFTGFYNPESFHNHNNTLLKNDLDELQSRTYAATDMDNLWKSTNGNFNFRHVFDSTGKELTADFDYMKYVNSSNQLLANYFFDANGNKNAPNDSLRGIIPADIKIYSGKVDYSHPLKGNAKIEAGIKASVVKTDNDARYDSIINGQPVADLGRTNHFIYEEQIKAGYVNFSKQINKKWSAQVGLRIENTLSKGNQATTGDRFKRDYTQLFPTAYVSYQPSEKHAFTLNYGRRIDRPDYGDLNPFYFFLDRYTYQVGNPNLKAQFSHSIEFTHTFKGFLSTTLNYYKATDLINDVIDQNEATNETFVRKSNIAKQDQLGLTVNANFPVHKWLNVSIYTNLVNDRFRGFINNANVDLSTTTFTANSSLNFNLGKGWNAELSGFYRSKGLDGVLLINPLGAVNGGISKSIMKNKGTVRLRFGDIFNTQGASGNAKYSYIDTYFKQVRDSRQVGVSFTYRFGKAYQGQQRRRTGGANEEQNRVKAGGNN